MVASVTSRLAGKALGDFLKVATGAVSGVAEKATRNYLLGQTGATGLMGALASRPETVAKLAGVAAPVAASGLLMGGAKLLTPDSKTTKQPTFSTQQYAPGVSPLTNAHMASMLLEQQRYQQQLQLIQARESAHAGHGSLKSSVNLNAPLGMLQNIYTSTTSY